jgi:oligoribonuclease NrnB/cAMP/cGMP phosphodiesterase (DHH superfamily)
VDHHKTAVNELAGLTYCHVDTNHSGAYLAWRYFFGDEKVPLLLQYVEDRDLWKFELLFSKEFSANLQSYPRNFDTWDDIGALVSSAGGLSSFTEAGRAILRSNDQHVERMVARAVKKPIGGYEVPVVNASILYSEVGEALWKKFDAPFAAYYFDRGDGKQQWGLRGRPGFDVSEVAKQFGGGGHAEAAGFVIDTFQPLVIK